MSRILMVVTAADSIDLADGTTHRTGFWAEELVVAHRALTEAGHQIALATPAGKRPPIDPGSIDPSVAGGQERVDEFLRYLDSIETWLSAPATLAEVDVADFDAVVLPGGHGPMTDLAFDPDLGKLLIEANERRTLIAPFCHGPAGLLSAIGADGKFAFAGRHMTGFTTEEELAGGLGAKSPWFVTDRLSDLGALIEDGQPWTSHVVTDGNLITGQNPQSSEAVATAIIEALGSR